MQVVNRIGNHLSMRAGAESDRLTGVVRAGGGVVDRCRRVEDVDVVQQTVSSGRTEVEGAAGEGAARGALACALLSPAHLHRAVRKALHYLARVFRVAVQVET